MTDAGTPEGDGTIGRRWNARPRSDRISTGEARRNPLVNRIKFALLGLSALLVVALLAWPQFTERSGGLPIDFSEVDVGAPTSTMSNARFISGGAHTFNITADQVVQDAESPELVHLTNIAGDTTTEDGAWFSLSALNGNYDREAQRLILNGDVALFTDSGNELHSANATFELAEGRITGGDPVTGHGPFGRITANRFEVVENGETIRFRGDVTLVIETGAGEL
jgi:lipopolysaccharide export system protein LptC